MRNFISATVFAVFLAGCGGDKGSAFAPPPPVITWQAGVFQPAATFANLCAAPRTGSDPFTHQAYPDMLGSALAENNWLRSWTNDLYLWYGEVPDLDPALYTTPNYFDLLRTTAVTASGAPKDKFHFTYPTAQWEAMSLSGVQAGYGPQWDIVAATPPRRLVVAYMEPQAPATATDPTLARGAEVVTVDGVDVQQGTDLATINAGLWPLSVGESHTFVVRDLGSATTRTITLVSASITSTPVQDVTTVASGGGTVGYMLFNDHLATSEAALVDAFTTLQAASVTDLVLDIRYNGGGYLDIASEVAYMIAGAAQTAGQTFELEQFNDKHPTVDPVTLATITPVPFHGNSLGFAPDLLVAGQPLPTLNLSRVFVLTGSGTCSASEAIINGLRGVNVAVIQVGSTTCGKPYGFYPQDNCGTTYFSIEFRGVNALDFGDYTDGFSPANTLAAPGVLLPGCSVADDFAHALGDPAEGRFAAALGYLNTSTCPNPPTGLGAASKFQSRQAGGALLPPTRLRQLRMPGIPGH
jgi:hypothetical protein